MERPLGGLWWEDRAVAVLLVAAFSSDDEGAFEHGLQQASC